MALVRGRVGEQVHFALVFVLSPVSFCVIGHVSVDLRGASRDLGLRHVFRHR